MSKTPSDLKYASTHEWARLEEDGTVTVGITDHAQDALGDVVFVELPEVGTVLDAGEEAGVVESVKAASDVYAPVDGSISEVNEALSSDPALVNTAAESDGWLYKITLTDPSRRPTQCALPPLARSPRRRTRLLLRCAIRPAHRPRAETGRRLPRRGPPRGRALDAVRALRPARAAQFTRTRHLPLPARRAQWPAVHDV